MRRRCARRLQEGSKAAQEAMRRRVGFAQRRYWVEAGDSRRRGLPTEYATSLSTFDAVEEAQSLAVDGLRWGGALCFSPP
jgi:hypothetical protein